MENWMQIALSILGGGVAVAIINALRDRWSWKRGQKDRKRLDVEQEITDLKTTVGAIKEGLRYVLYDRIRFIGQAYIAEGKIDFDDRRVLNDMHKSYHSGLGGNGDLDNLMGEVNRLPLKKG